MTYIFFDRSSTLSLWEVDPYWKSQLLVDYSKDLYTCMILDDQLHEEGYSVQEGVIYYHGRIFLSRASKLKEKSLQRAYEEFFFSHTYSMKAYNTIMESYTWKGFEEELYQHFQRCMCHVELEERHESMKELFQPPLSSFGMRGDTSMHHSICMRRNCGEEYACVSNDSFYYDLYYFTMYVQAIAPKRSIIPHKLHGKLWVTKISEHGHSLGDQREILYHCGCIPKAPNISHTFSHSEMTWEASKWWENHLPCMI